MKIHSMTATFGKLAGQTVTLKPGLNVIQAPNEWGKSTWCAFLTAMFYGLDTRSHSTKTVLSEKERYTPWSGAPMSGQVDLNWNGRNITIERRTKGRTILGEFRAYETDSGLPVPELTAQNCGQLLLGVEKTVFTRSSMIRQTDLPVTQDDTLRRRLNALVTTGDDSGAAENLEGRLRELKNKCRYNRSGLLPQTEAQLADLDRKLSELDRLEVQSQQLRQRCAELESSLSDLENHRETLLYQHAQNNRRLYRQSEAALQTTEEKQKALESQCAALPSADQALQTRAELLDLQQQWASHRLEDEQHARIVNPLYRDMTPAEALVQTRTDASGYKKLRKLPIGWLILPLLTVLAGITLLLLIPKYAVAAWWSIGVGLLGAVSWSLAVTRRRGRAKAMTRFYGNAEPTQWLRAAESYVNLAAQYQQSDAARQEAIALLRQQTEALCQGQSLTAALEYWQGICAHWDALYAAQKERELARERLRLLASLPTDVPVPERPDQLTLTEDQTRKALISTAGELRQLQLRLGQCQGQMEAIGHRSDLENRRNQVAQRLYRLEDTYAALELALATLEQARNALQRRFAPRITARAQDILQRLTEGRYDRLVLGEDLTLQANIREEGTLRSALWRSDGTADLLYLALRLAIAGELAPEAPLILDDALIRFDDRRLAKAIDVLMEEATGRQIILFTCHSREAQYMQKKEP